MSKKRGLEGNFYTVAKAILYEHIDMGRPNQQGQPTGLPTLDPEPKLPVPRDHDYWKNRVPHIVYGNIYYPYHCTKEGTVEDCNGNVAGEHMRFPDAVKLARKLNDQEGGPHGE